MQKIPYVLAIGSLMYAQVCAHLDIAYIVEMLGRYLSNPRIDHWKATKRIMRYYIEQRITCSHIGDRIS